MLAELLANGVVFPGFAAAIMLLIAARSGLDWFQAAAIPAALVAASVGLGGLPDLWPTDATDWLAYLALAAIPVAVGSQHLKRAWQRWTMRIAFVGVGVALLVQPLVEHTWSLGQTVAWWTGLSAMFGAAWMAIERLIGDGEKPRGLALSRAAVLTIALGGGAAAAAAISTLVIGIHAGAVTTGVAMIGLNVWYKGRTTPETVASLVPTIGFVWVVAYLYGGIPGWSMLLIAFAPVFALAVVSLGKKLELEHMRLTTAAAAALAAISIGGSVFIAEQPVADVYQGADRAEDTGGDSDSYYPY